MYTYNFPLHFIAKVKVKEEKEEICSVQCCHNFKLFLFIVKHDANVILFLEKQAFTKIFFENNVLFLYF